MGALDPTSSHRRRALDSRARHDRYRRLRENMLRHQSVSRFRTAKQFCEVCQTFEPDESGRCPLCAPATSGRSGNVVDDLQVQREHRSPAAGWDADGGQLGRALGRPASREPHDGAA